MTRLHQAEAKTRVWPEDRVRGAQRRFGREIVRDALVDLEYWSLQEMLDRWEMCDCDYCNHDGSRSVDDEDPGARWRA